MSLHKFILLMFVLGFVAATVFVFWPKATVSKAPDTLQTFAVCLREKGAVMYGSDTCSQCQQQKKMFGEFFKEINYVNCDFHQASCESHHINIYPVWIFEKSSLLGLQSLKDIALFTGCPLQL